MQVSSTFVKNGQATVTSENYGSGDFQLDPSGLGVVVAKSHSIMPLDPSTPKGYMAVFKLKDVEYNVTIEFVDRGYKVRNGKSYLGEGRKEYISHRFVPYCKVSGTARIKGQQVDCAGTALYVEAVSTLAPHAVANTWDFFTFHAPAEAAAVNLIGFRTPAKYGNTEYSQGSITLDGKLVSVLIENTSQHVTTEKDPQNGYNIPTEVAYTWSGKTLADNQPISATAKVVLGKAESCIDILAELPWLIRKAIQAIVAKPFLYQFVDRQAEIEIKVGDAAPRHVKGRAYTECTFVNP